LLINADSLLMTDWLI